MFSGKTLLITGGTGSFGNAVLKRFLKTDIAEIRVFSRDEKKQEDMRLGYNDPKLQLLHRRRAASTTASRRRWRAWTTCFTPPR